jgi:phosphatidylglycerophosphatase C
MKKHTNPDTIAAFDFDGTLTRKDTLQDFLIHTLGWSSYCLGIISTFSLLAFLIKIIDSHTAKEALFTKFFNGWSERQFNESCKKYALTQIDNLIRDEGRTKIDWHLKQGHRLIIVSASLKNWIEPWAMPNGFSEVIATEPAIKHDLITGKFVSKNCNGEEKRRRFLKRFPNRDEYSLYVYGDSRGDKALLSIADKPFYRRFF